MSAMSTDVDAPPTWWSRIFAGQSAHADGAVHAWAGYALACLAAFLFFFQLHQPLLDPDEGRQAEIPRVMLTTGDWVVPRWRGQPYHEKPPLQYWLTACVYAILGTNPASARVIPASAACLTLLLTYLWGRRSLGRRPALVGALVLSLTPGFFLLGRTVLLDSLLTLLIVAGWTCGQRALEGAMLHRRWWLASALMCGLGLLQKGPVACVLILVPLMLYSRLQLRAASVGWRALLALTLIAGGVALPWYAAMALSQPTYLETFLWRSNVIRFVQPFDHVHPWWFYGPVLVVGTFPWSLLLPGVLVYLGAPRLAQRRPSGLGLMVLAFAWSVLFYSLSGCKSPPYLMPVLPPLALVMGAFLNALLFHDLPKLPLLSWTRTTLPVIVSLGMLLLAPVALCIPGQFEGACGRALYPGLGTVLVLLLAWWHWVRSTSAPLAWGFVGLLSLLGLIVPLRQSVWAFAARRSPESMVQVVSPLLRQPETRLILFDREWPSAHFYLHQQTLPYFDRPRQNDFGRYVQTSLRKHPNSRFLVLVDNGPKVDNLVKSLPPGVGIRIERPPSPDQPALLILFKDIGYSSGNDRPRGPLPFRSDRL